MERFFKNEKKFVGPKAADELKSMRKRYGLPDREISQDQIKYLTSEIKKKLYNIKHQLKGLEPLVQVYLKEDPDFLTKRLVDPKKFHQEVREALDSRKEASSFLQTRAIDQEPEKTLEKLEDTHNMLKNYQKQLEGPEIGIEEIHKQMKDAWKHLHQKKVYFERYKEIMNKMDKEEFENNLRSADGYSKKYLDIKSLPAKDRPLEAARVFIKFREANMKLSKIIEEQKTPEKIQKGLDEQSVLANKLLKVVSIVDNTTLSEQQTQDLSMSRLSIQEIHKLIKGPELGKVNKDNLPDAIEAFELLAIANKTLGRIVQQSPEVGSSKQKLMESQEQNYDIEVLDNEKLKETQKEKFGQLVERAKEGLERFKKSYLYGSERWRGLLTTHTDIGLGLRAMYLGLKPMLNFGTSKTLGGPENLKSLLKMNAVKDFQVIDDFVFVESSVKKVLTKYPYYFDDYTPGSSVSEYMSDFIKQFPMKQEQKKRFGTVPTEKFKSSPEKYHIRMGLLFGYPPDSVKQFAKHFDAIVKFTQLSRETNLSSKERGLLNGYRTGSTKGNITDKAGFEKIQDCNEFRDK